MKIKMTVITIIGMSLGINAQVTDTGDKVGTGTASPSAKLDIYGNNNPVSFRVLGGSTNANSATLNLGVVNGRDWELVAKKYISSEGYALSFNHKTSDYQGPVTFSWMNNEKVRIEPNGNVGIGDTNPTGKLSLRDGNQVLNFLTNKKLTGTWPPSNEVRTMTIQSSGSYGGNIAFATGNSEKMRVSANGNVGIGTTRPDMKLTVKGNIHAEEVKIDLNVPAPDYVFKSDYKLRSIEEVESFIKANSHLPEIPSAKEFAENGVMQAEMDMNLLKKIEELTLYTIAQEKEIKKEKAENKKQQKEIDELKTLVQKLLKDKN